MPKHTGVDHFSLTVTDVEESVRFYEEVMGLLPLLDFGHGRLLMDRDTGFTIAVVAHEGRQGKPFTHLATGLDHLGFGVQTYEELEGWRRHLDAHGVAHSGITAGGMAHHLNFRDPDGIALEITVSTPEYAAAMTLLRENDLSDAEIRAYAAQLLGPELVIGAD